MQLREIVGISPDSLGRQNHLRRRLRRVIAPIGFVIVIMAALLSITAYSYYSNRRDALTLSDDLLRAIERRIAKELETFVNPIEDTVQLTSVFLENIPFDVSNRTLLEPLAFKVLANLSQISNFYVADTRGNFLMVQKKPDGSNDTKIINRTQKATQVTWIRRDPAGNEIDFQGALDPHTPIGNGWLRASHRKLDPELTREYRPYHTHDEYQPLVRGEVYELDVEIWPTSIVVPAGCRIALTLLGKDFERPTVTGSLGTVLSPMRGSGPFLHDNPIDRPADIFDNEQTIHGGGERGSYLLLPVIPPR